MPTRQPQLEPQPQLKLLQRPFHTMLYVPVQPQQQQRRVQAAPNLAEHFPELLVVDLTAAICIVLLDQGVNINRQPEILAASQRPCVSTGIRDGRYSRRCALCTFALTSRR